MRSPCSSAHEVELTSKGEACDDEPPCGEDAFASNSPFHGPPAVARPLKIPPSRCPPAQARSRAACAPSMSRASPSSSPPPRAQTEGRLETALAISTVRRPRATTPALASMIFQCVEPQPQPLPTAGKEPTQMTMHSPSSKRADSCRLSTTDSVVLKYEPMMPPRSVSHTALPCSTWKSLTADSPMARRSSEGRYFMFSVESTWKAMRL
mmetsp:Transcript_63574/g.176273  ORF Transcript_63574/g.176273 Transcript_63574/m.176273 type:complete len:209 (-) Transcript_63574:1347-1973(-)